MKKIVCVLMIAIMLCGCTSQSEDLSISDMYDKAGDVYTLAKDIDIDEIGDDLEAFTTFIQCIGDYDAEDVKTLILEHPEVYEEFLNSGSITVFEGFIPRDEEDGSIDLSSIIDKTKSFIEQVEEHKDELSSVIDAIQSLIQE